MAIRFIAVVAAIAAAVGAIVVAEEVEVTLLMVSAVIAGLACFDTAMNRSLKSFLPWLLLSFAPVTKTIPTVWFDLRSGNGLLAERYDHVGSLLMGVCVFGAVLSLSRPAESLGNEASRFDAAVIFGSTLAAALAGASVAFLFDTGFGSMTAARFVETATWALIGGLLAATVLAASSARTMSTSLTGVLCAALGTAGLLAYSVAGRSLDRGLWAAVFAVLTVSAVGVGSGALGTRSSRDRRSVAGIVVALIGGVIAAAAAISARSDRSSWAPGWVLLGIMALALFALAMASRPLPDRAPRRRDTDDFLDRTVGDLTSQLDPTMTSNAAAKEAALRTLRSAAVMPDQSVPDRAASPDFAPPPSVRPVPEATPVTVSTADAEPIVVPAAHAGPAAVPPSQVEPAAMAAAEVEPGRQPVAEPAQGAPDRSSLRGAPVPLAQAHHVDPSTGLLSAAGLQHAIGQTFAVPRQAAQVTMLMFAIRDLDAIEAKHGRLASAAVTREVAERVQDLLATGTSARFARSAYAVIFVGQLGESQQAVERFSRVMLQLRAPVEGGSLGIKIDIVGSMAQCYEAENSASFVTRANEGLARAMRNPDPTFVVMP